MAKIDRSAISDILRESYEEIPAGITVEVEMFAPAELEAAISVVSGSVDNLSSIDAFRGFPSAEDCEYCVEFLKGTDAVFSEDLEEMLYDDFDWAEYNGYDADDEDWDETDDCDGTRLTPAVLERPPYRQSATTKVGGLVSFTEVFAALCCPEPDEDEWLTGDELSYPPDGFLDATNISSTELATVVYPLAVALLYRDAKCRIDDYVARECKKLGVDHYNTDVTLEFGERSNKWCVVDYFDYPDYAFYESCAEFVVEVCTLADISTSEWRSFYHIDELGDTGKTRVKLSIPVGTVTEETRQKLEELNSAFNAKMAKHKKRNIFDGADLIFN